MKTTVYLIRHAEAEGNVKRVFQGSMDAKLSETGYLQLYKLAERCRSIPFDAIYSSPLTRACETAKAAGKHRGLPLIKADGLREIDGGDLEGRPFAQIPELFPGQWDIWESCPHLFAGIHGESMRSVYDRMVHTVLSVVRQNRGKTVGIVSHGCALRNFMVFAHQESFEHLKDMPWCANTGMSRVDFDGNLNPTVVFECDSSHLNETLANPALGTR